MEDEVVAIHEQSDMEGGGGKSSLLAAVFDGHGGPQVSEYLKDKDPSSLPCAEREENESRRITANRSEGQPPVSVCNPISTKHLRRQP